MFGSSRCRPVVALAFILLAACTHDVALPLSLLPAGSGLWIPGSTPPAPPVREGTSGGQLFDCPFPPGADRLFWDVETRLDLSGADGMEFVYTCDNPSAFRGITWYARSGSGWLAASLPVGGGRRRCWIPLSSFEPLDKPAGWQQITGFRVSPWAAGQGAGHILLYEARARTAEVAIARPDASSSPNTAERAYGERAADWIGSQLARLAVPYAMIPDASLADSRLERFRLIILPYNPEPSSAELKALRAFVKQGGHLMVSYNANRELADMMGVRVGSFLQADRPGRWHSMGFDPLAGWSGPERVFHGEAPHLLTADPGPDAQVAAWWLDARGRRQPEAACLLSPRGVWFTQVLSAGDDAAQRRMMAALFDRFVPGFFDQAAQAALDDALARADRPLDMLPQSVPLLELEKRATDALAARKPSEAWDLALQIAAEMDVRLAHAEALPADGMRGIWDHTGKGLYPGDWERTARELREAGITDVFAYVPREGANALPAAVKACSAFGINVHAWLACWNLDGASPEEIRRLQAAGNLQQSSDGSTVPWLCPAQPANRASELRRLLQAAETPGLAGVHLDYIRYPDAHYCRCPACRKTLADSEGEPARHRAERARPITSFVKEFSDTLRAKFPRLKRSAAVYPLYPDCLDSVGQDWAAWLQQDLLDFICPMSYTEKISELTDWTSAQTALPGAAGRIMAGLGVTSSHSRLTPAETVRQARAARAAGAAGIVIFDLNHSVARELFPVLRTPPHAPNP